MRNARALLLGVMLLLVADNASAARLGFVRASCLSEAISPWDAVSACTAVLQKFHRQTAVFLRRGAAFAELGAFDYAIGDFSRAIRLDPGDALAFQLRGLAYELAGRLAESLEDYRQAQALGRADPALAAAVARVTQALAPPPPPIIAAGEPPGPKPATAATLPAPEAPARAADGWLIGVCLLAGSAALAIRLARRREAAAA
ncbi:MAG: tetratricopeptide repeat protein [Methylocystis sp.]|uniref:tetratricopeptide repeat protein n=1 Tax=Methylocystis sp. TaxID=1911079 RepID=UPI003DA560AF